MPPIEGNDLHATVEAQIAPGTLLNDADVQSFVAHLRARHGDNTVAILMYGSYLRGKRDTVLDFYVLLDKLSATLSPGQALANRLLPPNVYHVHLSDPGLRAKYATISLHQFVSAMSRPLDCYFWARFAQPVACVYVREPSARDDVVGALTLACRTFIERTAGLMPPTFDSASFWQTGFAATYATELRAERSGGADALYHNHQRAFDDRLCAYAAGERGVMDRPDGSRFSKRDAPGRRQWVWWVRRVAGKSLSVLRLIKAAATFEDGLAYLLWKIERHSGIYIEPSDRQLKHPLLFAWPLLWRLYRRGAFR